MHAVFLAALLVATTQASDSPNLSEPPQATPPSSTDPQQHENAKSKNEEADVTTSPQASQQVEYLPDRPLQLVHPDSTHRKLVLVDENVQHLHRIADAVAVVAVVGKYHSGKSFLLNQLMGKSSGFGVGPSVRPKTMGIWMWGKPRSMMSSSGKNVSVIFLDTEGFAAENASENYDAKIFSVASLLSSYLLFNSIKIIDQVDIDYLELLARRTRLFALRSQMSKVQWVTDFNHDLIKFPPLMWAVQDFVQAVSDSETPRQWLHRLMTSSSRDSEEHEISLLGIFDRIDCHTLFIPAVTKDLLQDLSKAKESDLTPDYKSDRDALLEKLRLGLIPKEKNGRPINGAELASLLRLLVDAANGGLLARIPNRWESFIDQLKGSAQADCLKFYEAEMARISNDDDDQGPVNAKELRELHVDAANKTRHLLESLLFGLRDVVNASLSKLTKDIEEKYRRVADTNNKKIIIKCNECQKRMEVQAEAELGKITLPVLTSELVKEHERIAAEVETKYRKLLKYLEDSDAFQTSFEDMKKALVKIRDAFLLKNTEALKTLLKAAKEAATSSFDEAMKSRDRVPLPEKEFEVKLEDAEKDALKLYVKEAERGKEEDLFSVYQDATKSAIGELRKKAEKRNNQLIRSECEKTALELVGEFRSRTAATEIPLPLNETELNRKMDHEMDSLLSEYSQTLAKFSQTEGYKDIKHQLKEDFLRICDQRRNENVAAYTKEVEVPLKTAKKLIQLAAHKYDTAYSVHNYMVEVCMLNLDEGKPKSWEKSLKVAIVDTFIAKDPELQAIIAARNTFWLNLKGVFQWFFAWMIKVVPLLR